MTAPAGVDAEAWARGLAHARAGRQLAIAELTDLVADLEARGDVDDVARVANGHHLLERLTGIERAEALS